MFTVRATKRLLARMKVAPASDTTAATTVLGDWCANLVHVGRLQLVLAVSERTFLPVVVAAAPSSSLVERLRVGIGDLLRALGVSDAAIAREDAAMASFEYGKATNRQAMGVMVDFAKALPFYVEDTPGLLALSLKLADTPCGPLYKTTVFPDRTAVALLARDPIAVVH